MSKHIFITGGASGIGKELARRYLQAGDKVSLFDLQDGREALTELQAIAQHKSQIHFYNLNIVDNDAVNAAFDQAAQIQTPDIIINSAGICEAITFEQHSNEAFKRIIDVNLYGSRNVSEAAIKQLKSGGQLVLFASMAGLIPCYGYSAYASSKAAVISLAEILRLELKAKGIRVSVVCPPEVETPMVEEERKHRSATTVKMKLMAGHLSLEYAGKAIYTGINAKKFMICPGIRANILWILTKLSPRVITQFITDLMMPKTSDSE